MIKYVDNPNEEMEIILDVATTEKEVIIQKRYNKRGIKIDKYTAKLVKIYWDSIGEDNKNLLLNLKLFDRITFILNSLKLATNFKGDWLKCHILYLANFIITNK